MSSKQQTHSNTNVIAKPQAAPPAAQHMEQQLDPDAIIRRARHELQSLSPQDVMQMQRMVGNRVVERLMHSSSTPAAILPASHSNRAMIQRRTSVVGQTIVTPENEGEIAAYIKSKQKYDQDEEEKHASRQKRPAQKIPELLSVPLPFVIEEFKKLYIDKAPNISLDTIILKLREWANAKGPSEVVAQNQILPLVSTQDNSFNSYEDLFFALVTDILSERSKIQHEEVAFEVLENLDFYLPTLEIMLQKITERSMRLNEDVAKRMVKAGYADSILTDLPPSYRDFVYLILFREKNALRKLYLAVNTIHSFAITTKQLFPKRQEIEDVMGKRRDKYSPFGPEIEKAREKGFAVWSGFSGSTGDILHLAQNFGLPPENISHLAALTAAFFYFLPTSKNPTHTLHEVMEVANKYFNVPYDPQNPKGTLPHKQIQFTAKPERGQKAMIPRIGEATAGVVEIEISKLVSLHDVPRMGVPEENITKIRDMIREKGFDLKYPVSATYLPNGTLLVTGGHHRIAAMKLLGDTKIPVKIYAAHQTDPIFLGKMVGIARITGKYYSGWIPELNDLQREQVNSYLQEWMKHNTNQVRYQFQYPLRISEVTMAKL